MTRSLRLVHGDCLDVLPTLYENSYDSLVCDPPYGLSKPPPIVEVLTAWLAELAYVHNGRGFMGRTWDSLCPGPRYWREAFRVLKPGSHGIVFAGQRTIDLMGISLRLAGFEVRESGAWCAWSSMPKSKDIGKAIDDYLGAEREVVGPGINAAAKTRHFEGRGGENCTTYQGVGMLPGPVLTAPATPEAQQWDGWGTGTKQCLEPFLLIRKPLSESSIARNVLRWGTGGINIDATRFKPGDPMWVGPNDVPPAVPQPALKSPTGLIYGYATGEGRNGDRFDNTRGRFPANLVYCPKVSRRERERGCEHLPRVWGGDAVGREEGSAGINNPRAGANRTAGVATGKWRDRSAGDGSSAPGYVYEHQPVANHHPTVKPVKLLRWLMRLVTPPGGTVLDPYMGSGSCGIAAALEGFDYLGIELDTWDDNDPRAKGGATYLQIARARIAHATSGRWLDAPPSAAVEDTRPQVGMFG